MAVLIVAGFTACGKEPVPEKSKSSHKIMYSSLAGRWYANDFRVLRRQFKGFIDKAKLPKLDGNVMALLLPHAGYRWSGPTAAYGIKAIQGKKYSRVIVIGPSHSLGLYNHASIPDITHLETPLGRVPLDIEAIKKLRENSCFMNIPRAHSYEHSVQIEVPLLQYALKDFNLVPVVIGQVNESGCKRIAQALLSVIDDQTLVVISSDFTHYGRRFHYAPFKKDISGNIRKLDMGAFKQIENHNLTGFLNYVDKTKATICGRSSIGVLLAMMPVSAKVKLLKYSTSEPNMDNSKSSVSYVCAAVLGNWSKVKKISKTKDKKSMITETLSAKDKKLLLELARKTLTYYIKNRRVPTPEQLGITITPGMKQIMGAFVTLHENGRLRGCIGEIVPRRELYKAVMGQAVNAGLRDPRFRPVTADELPQIDFEISALTPSKPVDSYKDIVIGKHGMTLSKNGRRAVFLPQVAPEQGWNLAQTLSYLAMKARLPADAWKHGAKFTVFEAIVFHEPKKSGK